MSLITRCPACGTMFKVVPDQLRISEGWVRCGHCAEIFDAAAQLQQASGLAVQPVPAVDVAPTAPVSEAAQFCDEAATPLGGPTADDVEPSFDAAIAPSSALAEPERQEPELHEPLAAAALGSEPAEPATIGAESLVAEVAAQPADPDAAWPAPPVEVAAPISSSDSEPAFESSELVEPGLQQISFVQEARRKAFWRRPLIRALLVLLCLALLVGLALQLAVHERDRLAALEPRLKPLLHQLCEPLACTVAPRRQIEAIVIDSSSFNKTRGDTYRLNFTIKNTASTELAMPGVELSLTDTQDRPVLRRVLMPADLGAAAVLAAGAEWSGSLALGVAANGSAARIAGYRVLAFYP